jgi:hypothetical protein
MYVLLLFINGRLCRFRQNRAGRRVLPRRPGQITILRQVIRLGADIRRWFVLLFYSITGAFSKTLEILSVSVMIINRTKHDK